MKLREKKEEQEDREEETSQELRNCPMGKEMLYWKKGFIEKKALLKERLYWKNLVEIVKFGRNCEIW